MSELIFDIKEAEVGGYVAKCLTQSIFTEGETIDELRVNVKEAVNCYFEDENHAPKLIRLHFVKDELISLGG